MELIMKLAAKLLIAAGKDDVIACQELSAKITKVMSTYDKGC